MPIKNPISHPQATTQKLGQSMTGVPALQADVVARGKELNSTSPASTAAPGPAMYFEHRPKRWIARRGVDRDASFVTGAWVGAMLEEHFRQLPHARAAA